VLFGLLDVNNWVWLGLTPIISGAFLAITGGLLVWDLEHPERFYMIFTKPQWRSWLVKGAFIIAGYTFVLLIHFIASLLNSTSVQLWLLIPGLPLGTLTAIYTAYLFAQAKARDLWQNPLLPPHLLVQSLLLGSAGILLLGAGLDAGAADLVLTIKGRPGDLAMLWILGLASLLHLLMIWGEASLTHSTAHARVAIWEMTRGRYRHSFWMGLSLSILGGLIALMAILGVVSVSVGVAGAPLAMLGVMLYEHAYVQAGQSVPLA
jgi:formate-dependent nitrite reductase membrane component NrfD